MGEIIQVTLWVTQEIVKDLSGLGLLQLLEEVIDLEVGQGGPIRQTGDQLQWTPVFLGLIANRLAPLNPDPSEEFIKLQIESKPEKSPDTSLGQGGFPAQKSVGELFLGVLVGLVTGLLHLLAHRPLPMLEVAVGKQLRKAAPSGLVRSVGGTDHHSGTRESKSHSWEKTETLG